VQETIESTGIYFVSDPGERKEFLKFPYTLYKDHPQWIAPLMMEQKKLVDTVKNPFYETADLAMFVATRNGKTAGRIAAIHNKAYNEHHGSNIGFFGFFDCIDDQKVCDLLIKAVGDWFSERGISEVMGPTSPGMMDVIGVLVEGFEHEPCLLMAYNFPYYDTLLKNAGLVKAMDLFAYRVNKQTVTLDRMARAADIVRSRVPNLTIRTVNLKDFDHEVSIIRHIFNRAWARNWGFVPLSESQFRYMAKDLKTIIDTDFAHVAEVEGIPVAFSIALPDFNQALKHINGKLLPFGILKLLYYARKIHQIRTALMGVIPEFQGKGIDAFMHKQTIENGLAKGFDTAELSWILESNVDMIRVAERVGASVEKRYRMYSKTYGEPERQPK
jgi:GNAT superfamily N-acetyltransferase